MNDHSKIQRNTYNSTAYTEKSQTEPAKSKKIDKTQSKTASFKPTSSSAPQATDLRNRRLVQKKESSDVQSITFPSSVKEKQQLCDKLQVGDVIVTRATGLKKVESVDPFIVFLQKTAKFFGKSSKSADPTVVHVAIVTGIDRGNGRVLISEAMPSKGGGLRTVDMLSHASSVLEKGMDYKLEVLRVDTPYQETAKKAAEIALRLAPKASYLRSPNEARPERKFASKFSFKLAIKSIFKKHTNMNERTMRGIFKGLFEESINSQTAIGSKKSKKFFCSSFGAGVFQRSEASAAWDSFVKQHSGVAESLKDLKNKVDSKHPNKNKEVSAWSKKMTKSYGKVFLPHIKNFQFNSDRVSPQDFVDHLKNGIARPLMRINPPH